MIESYPGWLLYVIAGILGAILGSFSNVCIVRLPQKKSIVRPGSHCPGCGHVLSWWENIPMASFLILRGRCRSCRERISLRYPLVEGVCVLLSLFTWWYFREPIPYLVYFCLFLIPLVIITFIDLEHRIIPDEISLPGIIVGIAVHTLLAGPRMYGRAALDSVIGAAVGGALLFLIAIAYEKLRKQEGLGGGDVKLIAMLGAFLGWRAVILILLLSSILGSIAGIFMILILRKDMKYAIPYGPFLAFAGIFQLFYGQQLIRWYLGFFH